MKGLAFVLNCTQASTSVVKAPFELVFELAPDIPRSLDISKAPVAILGSFGELIPFRFRSGLHVLERMLTSAV